MWRSSNMTKNISDYIEAAWNSKSVKIDWQAYEQCMIQILSDKAFSDTQRVEMAKECLDAFTKRGHFANK